MEERSTARWHNLPPARTSFVGRKGEVEEIRRALATTRLLTLTGVGGSGKTRLALEVARDLVDAHPDGVWLVELAPLTEEVLVPQAVATAVGVHEQPNRSLTDTLVDAIFEQKVLLLMDNCEHLVEGVARLVDTLVESCAHLRILATSREALRVTGEIDLLVPPLSVPDPRPSLEGDVSNCESVLLFVERSRYHRPAFALTPRNASAVAEVCRRLDGIPLAIELAAARVGALSPEQIAQRLANSLKLLTVGSRTSPPKQRTLRGTLDWSYELLSKPEQTLFDRLSVFAGGWTLEATEVIGAGEGIEQDDVLDVLSGLVDKSLVMAEGADEDWIRYRMLETVKQYAREKFEERGGSEEVRHRHATFFLALAEESESRSSGAQQGASLEQMEAEHDNLRAALSWSLEAEPRMTLRLAVGLARFWEARSNYLEGSIWLEAALRKTERADDAVRAKALTEAGTFAWHRGDHELAFAYHGDALALYREQGDDHGAAFALMCLGVQEVEKGALDRAAPLYEEARSLSERIGDKRTNALSLYNLGELEHHRGNHGRAITLTMEGISLLRELGDTSTLTAMLSGAGKDAAYHGAYEAAAAFIKEGLSLARELRNGYCVALCLEGLAALAGAKGDGARAARLWGAAEALREAVRAPIAPVDLPDHERNVAATCAPVDEVSWEAAWAEGQRMTLEAAAEYALSTEDSVEGEHAPPTLLVPETGEALTAREVEVLRLLSSGTSNKQIAEELVISPFTVKRHVANAMRKLGVSSRTEAAARARDLGLV